MLTNYSGITVASGATATIDSALAGSSGLAKDQPGTLILGGANTYTGPTAVNEGILQLSANERIPNGSAVTISSNAATLDLNSFNETIGSLAGKAGSIVNVPLGSTLTFGGDNTPYTLWNGETWGEGLVAKVGTGTIDIGPSGYITNTLAISNGAVLINTYADLGNSVTPPVATADIIIDGGRLLDTMASQGATFLPVQRSLVLGPSGGTVELQQSTAIALHAGPGTFQGGTLIKDGPGELRTYSVEHSFAKLIVTNGLYTVGHSTSTAYNTAFGAIPATLTPDAITLLNGGQIRKAGGNNLALDPKQGITLGSGGGTIRGFSGDAQVGTFEITGPISGSGPLRLNSTADAAYGPIIVLSGNNTYSGGTIVQAGRVYVINTSGCGTGSGSVNVTNATLGGEGTIGGPVYLKGSLLTPGYSYNTGPVPATPVVKEVAKLVVTNGLNMSDGATNIWHLGGPSTSYPGEAFDQVELTGGNLVLGGTSVLSINFSNIDPPDLTNEFWQLNHQWTIVKLSGTAANPGGSKFTTLLNATYAAGYFSNYVDGASSVILRFRTEAPAIDTIVAGTGGANATITWNSQPGTNYNVIYKTNLNQPGWLFLTNYTAVGILTTITDTSPPGRQRYYRVVIP